MPYNVYINTLHIQRVNIASELGSLNMASELGTDDLTNTIK